MGAEMGKYIVGDTFTISIEKIIRHDDNTSYYIKGFKEPFTEKELDKIWDLEPSLSDQEKRMQDNYRKGYSDGFADGRASRKTIKPIDKNQSNQIKKVMESKSNPFQEFYTYKGEALEIHGIRIL